MWILNQASLFDHVPPAEPYTAPTSRSTDPETSRMAAAKVTPSSAEVRLLALEALNRRGSAGATDFDLEADTDVKQTSVGVRRKELERLGFCEVVIGDHGRPWRRLNNGGNYCIVSRITDAGRAHLRATREAA